MTIWSWDTLTGIILFFLLCFVIYRLRPKKYVWVKLWPGGIVKGQVLEITDNQMKVRFSAYIDKQNYPVTACGQTHIIKFNDPRITKWSFPEPEMKVTSI